MKNIIFYIVTSMMFMSYTPYTAAQDHAENQQINALNIKQISEFIKNSKDYEVFFKSKNLDHATSRKYSLLSAYFFTLFLQHIFLSDPSFTNIIPRPPSSGQNTNEIESPDSDQELQEKTTADLITLSELMDTLHHLEDDLEVRIHNIDRQDKDEIIQILLSKKELIESRLRNRGILNVKQNPPFLKTPLGITGALLTTTCIIVGLTLSSFDLVNKTWRKPSFKRFRSNTHHCSSIFTKQFESKDVYEFFDIENPAEDPKENPTEDPTEDPDENDENLEFYDTVEEDPINQPIINEDIPKISVWHPTTWTLFFNPKARF